MNDEVITSSLVTLKLNATDRLTMRLPGGGGYHSPFARDPSAVRNDVLDGFVSLEIARSVYGVVLDGPEHTLNLHATKSLRSELQNPKNERGSTDAVREDQRV